jgi:hypothetical protein
MTTFLLRTTAVRAARITRQVGESRLKLTKGNRQLAALAATSPSFTCHAVSHFQESDFSVITCVAAATLASIAFASTCNFVECESNNESSCSMLQPHRPPMHATDDSTTWSSWHHRLKAETTTLEQKYSVDFETVLGQGSYGCVHPACIKETGELVSTTLYYVFLPSLGAC